MDPVSGHIRTNKSEAQCRVTALLLHCTGVTVLPTGMAFCALHLLMTAPVHPIKPCVDMVLVSMKLTPM